MNPGNGAPRTPLPGLAAGGKRRLMLVLGALLVAGFLATSLASYAVSRREIRRSIAERELPLTSDTVYSEIQKDLVRPVLVSSMMASDTFLRDWMLAGERDGPAIRKYLEEVRSRSGAFTTFLVSEGTRRYYHPKGVQKQVREDNPDDAWYFRVRAMAEPYEINVDPDQANANALTIFINYRVLDYRGGYLGATGVGLRVDAVRQLLGEYQARYQRSVYFVDGAGRIVVGRGPGPVGARLADLPGLGAVAGDLLASREGTFQYRAGGRSHLLNARRVPELKWTLVVEKAEDDALAGILRTLYLNLAVCAAVSVVVLALTGLTVAHFQGRLELLATTDRLSGLLNREAFEVVLLQALAEQRRRPGGLSAVMVDIDHFKAINDRFGHLRGDQAIQAVAAALRSRLRASDSLCRWGGEEFLVLLRQCGPAEAARIAEDLREAVAGAGLAFDGRPVGLTISAGVATLRDGDTSDGLVDRADAALYAAKEGGRNRVASL